jgi:hypothetical protein
MTLFLRAPPCLCAVASPLPAEKPPPGCAMDAYKLLIGNVPSSIGEAQLCSLLQQHFGPVVQLSISLDSASGAVARQGMNRLPTASGHVWFANQSSADKLQARAKAASLWLRHEQDGTELLMTVRRPRRGRLTAGDGAGGYINGAGGSSGGTRGDGASSSRLLPIPTNVSTCSSSSRSSSNRKLHSTPLPLSMLCVPEGSATLPCAEQTPLTPSRPDLPYANPDVMHLLPLPTDMPGWAPWTVPPPVPPPAVPTVQQCAETSACIVTSAQQQQQQQQEQQRLQLLLLQQQQQQLQQQQQQQQLHQQLQQQQQLHQQLQQLQKQQQHQQWLMQAQAYEHVFTQELEQQHTSSGSLAGTADLSMVTHAVRRAGAETQLPCLVPTTSWQCERSMAPKRSPCDGEFEGSFAMSPLTHIGGARVATSGHTPPPLQTPGAQQQQQQQQQQQVLLAPPAFLQPRNVTAFQGTSPQQQRLPAADPPISITSSHIATVTVPLAEQVEVQAVADSLPYLAARSGVQAALGTLPGVGLAVAVTGGQTQVATALALLSTVQRQA